MNDKYALKARVYPMILFFLPAVVIAISFSLSFANYIHLLSSVTIVGALSFLFSQIGRDAGKKKEPGLWKDWGGMPSVQLLRYRNGLIDKNTKKRYHSKLWNFCPGSTQIDENNEQMFLSESDDLYNSWTRYIISKTRDTTKFNLLFKENINYGFRRNLWGLKWYAIALILILMCFIAWYFYRGKLSFDLLIYPVAFFIDEIILIILLLFWLIKINGGWVKAVAFSYAERLIEAVEDI